MPLASLLLLAVTTAPADASNPPDGPPPPAAVEQDDLGDIQGVWEVVSCVVGQHEDTDFRGFRWVFAGSSARLLTRSGRPAIGPVPIQYNPTADPPSVRWQSDSGPPQHGIYRRFGDVLFLAENHASRARPSSVEPAEGVAVWTLRRVRK
jgi:uncharacterized protein (TIGR03067 family)